MRVSRQWRNLKYRKWHGVGHDGDANLGEGSLALSCPVCPQPGINIPENWRDDPDQYEAIDVVGAHADPSLDSSIRAFL